MKAPALVSTKTGGREASTRHIPPKLALSVGMPDAPCPKGWRWVALSDVARLESGHTPSRRHPEYWGGSIPWLSIKDAKVHHGGRIGATEETTNEIGIANSSARVLPKNTVCLSRTASVGYVVVMDVPMATSQDFVNWVCSEELDPAFLQYLLIAEGEDILRFASGSVHQTIYFPEVKAFHVCLPRLSEQRRIVTILDRALTGIGTAYANAEKNCQNARSVFESHLTSVFVRRGTGWTVNTIGEVAEHSLGKMLDRGKNKGIERPYLRNVNVRWFSFDLSDLLEMRFLPEEASRYTAIRGDVLICEGGYPGRAAIWTEDYPIHFQKALHRVRFHIPDHAQWFVYYLYAQVQSDGLRHYFTGTGIQHFTGEALDRFELPIPPLARLRQFVSIFNKLFSESQQLESIYKRKLIKLDALKKSILREAFTGAL
jgi:type I restriction enzyme S subunit